MAICCFKIENSKDTWWKFSVIDTANITLFLDDLASVLSCTDCLLRYTL